MNNKNRIDGIVPFNEIYYKDCFYNSLFPIVLYFQKNILHFLVNDIFHYARSQQHNIPDIQCTTVNSIDKVFFDTGIHCDYKVSTDDIIGDLLTSLSQGRPAIVWIDCYYEAIRPEMYRKMHWPHTLAVFGYDQELQTFDIIEHAHKDNLAYEKRTIGFAELQDCYKGFLDNLSAQINRPTFYSLYGGTGEGMDASEQVSDENLASTLIRNVKSYAELISEGLNQLQAYEAEFEHLLLNEDELKKQGDALVQSFNNILNFKRIERYKLIKLFPAEVELLRNIDGVIDQWGIIRKAVLKYLYTGIYKAGDVAAANKGFKRVLTLEHDYLNNFV
ncbi:hypothetical protein [Paenibacillus sp.]|uniref:hypothetical protein n=1 Tax=Paenibacillus sp. TaxID=58172 RepID=UPI00283660C9|nr:hypothetical protein [Paenibacillus sp.]MDR0268475.1 BtrH N-terminal domain-containing protein [Paenibacillus sp.]